MLVHLKRMDGKNSIEFGRQFGAIACQSVISSARGPNREFPSLISDLLLGVAAACTNIASEPLLRAD